MNRRKFRILTCVAVSVVALCLMNIGHSQGLVEISGLELFVDEFGSNGLLDIRVIPPENSLLSVLYSANLADDAFITDTYPSSVLSAGDELTLQVVLDPGNDMGFFRVKAQQFPITVTDNGSSIQLGLSIPTPLGLIAMALSRETGLNVYLGETEDPLNLVQPTGLTEPNLDDLLAALGLNSWSTPPAADNATYAGRFIIPEQLQVNPLPDTEPGEGDMDDGWPGDTGLPAPIEGLPDPQPDPRADKPLVIEIPDVPDSTPQDPTGLPEPGSHLRLVMVVAAEGGATLSAAFEREGDALPPLPQRLPPTGALISVVRSPLANPNDDYISHIGALVNPFAMRSYEPPFRGSHGYEELDSAQVRIPVPLLPNDAIGDIEISVYRYTRPADFEELTPTDFLSNQSSFDLLDTIYGQEIEALIYPQAPQGDLIQPLNHTSTLTKLHKSGSKSKKFNFVVIGDGFDSSTTDQDLFNNYVQNVVMDDWLDRDIHPEILNAMNIFRINAISNDSGVTLVDSNGQVTTSRDTALAFRYSGLWSRCWMELAPNTQALMDAEINALLPEADGIAVVLNVSGSGGCARDTHFAVTRTRPWSTFAHEFGHFFGGLGDEYQCSQGSGGCTVYNAGEPTKPNLTKQTTRSQIKWKLWIPSTRPVPTAASNVISSSQDTGLFPGATIGQTQWWSGIYRPSWRGRMNDNSPPNNPVGYTDVRENAYPRQDGDFRKSVVGDFDGDGLTDLVILDDRQLSLYIAENRVVIPDDPITNGPLRNMTGVLDPVWYHTDILRNVAETKSWQIRGTDMLFPGDFDGDGMDDLYIVNLTNWSKPYLAMLKSTGTGFEPVRRYDLELPGWDDMRDNDEFYVGDFNNDGKDDLMVYNGLDWTMPYFIMLRSSGDRLHYFRRYDKFLPLGEMGEHEKFYVGDYNADGKDDVIAHNTKSWSKVHLMVFRSTATGLARTDRHYGTIQLPFWTMRRKDQLYVLDFDGDGSDDIAIFNGLEWNPVYLGLFETDAGVLAGITRYNNSSNNIPGWHLRRHDRFWTSNVDGDVDDDLVVFNTKNWATQYLGILRSDGSSSLSGTWQDDWIGGWNLSDSDSFHVTDFRGSSGWDDLFIFNKSWFGLLRSYQNRFVAEAIYRKWIHNHRFHMYGWW